MHRLQSRAVGRGYHRDDCLAWIGMEPRNQVQFAIVESGKVILLEGKRRQHDVTEDMDPYPDASKARILEAEQVELDPRILSLLTEPRP